MISDILFLIEVLISFLPFVLFAFFNAKANTKKEVRNRQYLMPIIAVVYSAVLLIFLDKLSNLFLSLFLKLADLFDAIGLEVVGEFIYDIYASWGIYLVLVVFNTAALLVYIILKRILTAIFGKIKIKNDRFLSVNDFAI